MRVILVLFVLTMLVLSAGCFNFSPSVNVDSLVTKLTDDGCDSCSDDHNHK